MKLSAIEHLHLDVLGGIAGDMFICACIDLIPDFKDQILQLAERYVPASAGQLKIISGLNSGIACAKLSFVSKHSHTHDHSHNHNHAHTHSPETSYQALKHRLESLPIEPLHKNISLQILTIIAKAEAKIHQTDLNQVHFHELADWDSFFDVLAAGYLLAQFKNCRWSLSDLPLGSGLVKTQHGLLAVPAPATAQILTGFTFRDDGIKGERITPTGAAILGYLKDAGLLLENKPQLKLLANGYGGGNKTFAGLPNVLRILAFSTANQPANEKIAQINCDIDDMTGEELAWALDKLRQQKSIVDVTSVTARGKKNRVTEQLCLLVKPDQVNKAIEACFKFTSTIGLRWQNIQRVCLSRQELNQDGLGVKKVQRPGDINKPVTSIKVDSDALENCTSLAQRRRLKQQIESLDE